MLFASCAIQFLLWVLVLVFTALVSLFFPCHSLNTLISVLCFLSWYSITWSYARARGIILIITLCSMINFSPHLHSFIYLYRYQCYGRNRCSWSCWIMVRPSFSSLKHSLFQVCLSKLCWYFCLKNLDILYIMSHVDAILILV